MPTYTAVFLIDPCGTTVGRKIEADSAAEATLMANVHRRELVGNGILARIEEA